MKFPKLKACPFCGCRQVELVRKGGAYFAKCTRPTCRAIGPVRNGFQDAAEEWNRRPPVA